MNKVKSIFAAIVIFCFICIMIPGKSADKKVEQKKEIKIEQEKETVTSKSPEEIREQEYIKKIGKINESTLTATTTLSNIFTEKPNFLLWTDEDVTKVAIATVLIELSYDTAKELNPPEKFKSYHSLYFSGLSKNAEAMPLLRYGIDNFDLSKIEQSTELIVEAAGLIGQANAELKKLQ